MALFIWSQYGELIRTAPNLVLKTSGARDGMGIDTSALRGIKTQPSRGDTVLTNVSIK